VTAPETLLRIAVKRYTGRASGESVFCSQAVTRHVHFVIH